LDVLTLINDINANSSRSLDGTPVDVAPFLDVNGDRFLSPLDVLMVINFINRFGGGGGEGEASPLIEQEESVPSGPSRLMSYVFDRDPTAASRILYRSDAFRVADQGPDRCGCQGCMSFLAAEGESSDAKGSIGKHRRVPDHWVKDDLFAQWD
jgi:hypothetical protein